MEQDYERTNAREWDQTHGVRSKQEPGAGNWELVEPARGRPPPNEAPQTISPRKWHNAGGVRATVQRNRPPPKLVRVPDNDAEASWRARQPAVDSVRIPDDLILKDKSDTTQGYHAQIARQHNTFLFDKHATGGSRDFGIWGDVKAVAATKEAIRLWVEEQGYGTKSARSAKFAKVVSLTPVLRVRAEKRWDREVAKQRYRQHPPPDMAFGAIGSFHWPILEYKPEEILGNNHEALDPIRMDCSCHVVWYGERSVFRVMGKPSEVQAGLQRIRRTCFQIAAKQLNPVRLYLLRWRNPSEVAPYVYLREYDPPAITSPDDADTPATRNAPVCDEYSDADTDTVRFARSQTSAASERLRAALFYNLSNLHYYRGHIQMRIRLGQFLVNQYKEPKYGVYDLKDEYVGMLGESQFSGEVTHELGDKMAEEALLSVMQAADDFLTPSEAMTHDLKKVKPIYAAIFTFADPNGNYRLSVEWYEAQDTAYGNSNTTNFELTSKKWTRLERDAVGPASLLDVSLCDLNSSSAWQFDILASPQVIEEAKLPKQLATFSRNLRIDPKDAKSPNNDTLFVRFNPFASLVAVQQRVAYQYTIADSDFTLELSRFQDRTCSARGTSSAPSLAKPIIVYQPRWSVNVFRKAWDATLAKNERLTIGEEADWQHDPATWFPYDIGPGADDIDEANAHQGWEQLMVKLGKLEGLVDKAREAGAAENDPADEDLLGRMTVG